MSNYVKATNFAVKDTLSTGDSNKVVRGTEIDTEFTAIASAISSKADSASPTFTGTPTAPTASTATENTQIATTAYVANKIGAIASGVSSFSAGTTGLTPSTSTTGNVTLAGTLSTNNGGTGSSTVAGARNNLGVPSTTGTGASGTWGINVTGSAATWSTPRTFTIGSTGKTVDGSADVSWSVAEIIGSTLGGIGSTIWAFYAATGPATGNRYSYLGMGSTVAGSSLRYRNAATASNVTTTYLSYVASTAATSAVFPTTGTTALTGTWMVLGGPSSALTVNSDISAGPVLWSNSVDDNDTSSYTRWYAIYLVRIS